jgi:hypothetical protein
MTFTDILMKSHILNAKNVAANTLKTDIGMMIIIAKIEKWR